MLRNRLEIAEFVEDDEVHAGEIIGDAALASGVGLGFEPVDEIYGGVEAAEAGSAQSLNGAPLRSAPGLRANTGT